MRNVIGIDLGGTSVKLGRIENNKIIESIEQNTPETDDQMEVVDLIISMIKKIRNKDTVAIGIGVPSVVDRENGIVYDTQNIPSWKKVHLKSYLADSLHLPIFIDNDANCFAIGENIYGSATEFENFVGITLGTGLGGGIVQNSKLLSDSNCGSGEFGEIPYLDSIIEDYCGGNFFKDKHGISGFDLYTKAINGNKKAIDIFNEYGKHIANVVKIIVLTIDPEAVIFGGSISKSFDFFENSMKKELKNFPYQNSINKLKILTSTLKNSAIFGAAALCGKI